MAINNYTQLHKTRRAIQIFASIALVAVIGILGVVFFQNTNQNPEISKASNLNELSTETKVTAVNTSGNDEILGLNARAASCSTEIVAVLDWGSTGTLVEPEGKVDTCVGRTMTWYHVKWDNGVVGWTVGDFLKFDNPDQAEK